MHHLSIGFLAASLAATAACAPQANENYLGEPLLRMRGQVSAQPLAASRPIVPALCFFEQIEPSVLKLDIFPEAVQTAFAQGTSAAPNARAHIVDVHTLGQFPAEFKVDVYKPPPQAPITSLFSGEPRVAYGQVCAVQVDHQAVAQWVGGTGHFTCEAPFPEGPCSFALARRTQDGARSFYETRACPSYSAAREQCQVTQGGDETLLGETGGFEKVVAMADGPEVVYLAEPAPAGSYTAYKLGAPDGLSAGYHVRRNPPSEESHAQGPLRIAALQAALAETNTQFGTDYPFLPEYGFEGGSVLRPPPHILDAYQRILARIEMETIPMIVREDLGPDDPGLTLELKPRDDLALPLPPQLAQPSQE